MKAYIKILLTLGVVGIIAAFLVYLFVYNKPHENYEKAKPQVEISAEALYNAFVENQTNAEQNYVGKVIQIEGSIGALEKNVDNEFVIFAFGSGMFGVEGIRCALHNNQHGILDNDDVNRTVIVKGYCTGFTGTDVVLEHCSIVR
jgi:hypothetical protein